MRPFIALLATTSLLMVAPPADAQDQVPLSSPVTVPSLVQPVALMQQLEESVGALPTTDAAQVRGVATMLAGWALGAVSLAVTADSQAQVEQGLQSISSGLSGVQQSLTVITGQLSQMSAELALIAQQQQWADCAAQTQTSSPAVAVIQAAADDYNQFIAQAQNASASDPPPEVSAMVDWAQEYTQDNDVLAALDDIDDMLMGTSSLTGSLAACGQALSLMYKGSDLTFEEQYYGALYSYLSYWYQTQVLGLNLYIEAQHMLAVDAAGQLTQFQPTDPSQICTEVISGPVTTACDQAYTAVTTVYDNLADQVYAAGAPYLWGSGAMITATSPAQGNKAWVVDINDFNAAGCTTPLTSNVAACGGTVGTTGPMPAWEPFNWGGYQGWQPAVTADWLDLFPVAYQASPQNHQPLAQAMATAGFGDASWGPGLGLQNLIIYTGEVTQSTNVDLNAQSFNSKLTDYQNTIWGMCLLDTAAYLGGGYSPAFWIRPLCDDAGGGVLSALVTDFNGSNTWSGVAPDGTGQGVYWGGGNFTNGTGFYNAAFSMGGKGTAWNVEQWPGWATGTYVGWVSGQYSNTPAAQYRWPVMPLSNAMCSVQTPAGSAMTATTAGGAYTMCGADFAAWVAEQLPPTPVPASAGSLTATAKRGKAVVTWRKAAGQKHVTGYRIDGKRGSGAWHAMATLPRSAARVGSKVQIPRPGWWRFRIVTLASAGESRPSPATRPTYVAVTRHASRYYTYRRAGMTRVVKAFSDGRVYFAGRHLSGVGVLGKNVVRGHTYRGPYRWTGAWQQPVTGSWRNLEWQGWQRLDGPARSRQGMPLPKAHFPVW